MVAAVAPWFTLSMDLLQTESKQVLFCGTDGHKQTVAMQPAPCTLPFTDSADSYPVTFIWKYDQRRYRREATIRQHRLDSPSLYRTYNERWSSPAGLLGMSVSIQGDPRSLRSQTCRRLSTRWQANVIPMTHDPETGAINRLHLSGAVFWYVCHANLGPDSGADQNTVLFHARKWRASD